MQIEVKRNLQPGKPDTRRSALIKRTAHNVINENVPIWSQINALEEVLIALIDSQTLPDPVVVRIDKAMTDLRLKNQIRQLSNTAEISGQSELEFLRSCKDILQSSN